MNLIQKLRFHFRLKKARRAAPLFLQMKSYPKIQQLSLFQKKGKS